jgi:anti-anti-sigma regulatory factor
MTQLMGHDDDVAGLDHHVRPAGWVLTVLKPDEVIVWLIGEIDLSLTDDLDQIASHAPRVSDVMTIDGSRVTFCDSTLIHFMTVASQYMLVTVRQPSRILVDILRFSRLSDRVFINPAEEGPR